MRESERIDLERALAKIEGALAQYELPEAVEAACRGLHQLVKQARGGEHGDRLAPWGVAEIAAHFGVSKNSVLDWRKQAGFPKPWRELRMGPVWRAHDVKNWRRRVLAERVDDDRLVR